MKGCPVEGCTEQRLHPLATFCGRHWKLVDDTDKRTFGDAAYGVVAALLRADAEDFERASVRLKNIAVIVAHRLAQREAA